MNQYEPHRLNFDWDKGSPWLRTWRLHNPPFTVSTATLVLGQYRDAIAPLLTLTPGSGITIAADDDDILITAAVTSEQTSALTFSLVYYALRYTRSTDTDNPVLLAAGRIRLLPHVVTP